MLKLPLGTLYETATVLPPRWVRVRWDNGEINESRRGYFLARNNRGKEIPVSKIMSGEE